jgi:hypothetical protein
MDAASVLALVEEIQVPEPVQRFEGLGLWLRVYGLGSRLDRRYAGSGTCPACAHKHTLIHTLIHTHAVFAHMHKHAGWKRNR